LPCRVPPVCTLGAAAMPPPTSAAQRRTGERRTRPAVTPPPPARRNRGAHPAAANRTSPGLPHRTPPAPAMGAHELPPQPRRAAKRARSRPPGAPPRSRPSHARARAALGRRSRRPPTTTHVPHFCLFAQFQFLPFYFKDKAHDFFFSGGARAQGCGTFWFFFFWRKTELVNRAMLPG